jgi:hypothetical protein
MASMHYRVPVALLALGLLGGCGGDVGGGVAGGGTPGAVVATPESA